MVNPVIALAASQFASAQLPFPYTPEVLAPRLRAINDWIFSTRDDDRTPYAIDDFVDEFLAHPQLSPYLMFGHDGHGMNSYAMHYFLVYERVALFDQLAWGGVYMDNAFIGGSLIPAHMAQIKGLVLGMREAAAANILHDDERLLLVNRAWGKCGWAFWLPGEEVDWRYMNLGIQTILNASNALDRRLGKIVDD